MYRTIQSAVDAYHASESKHGFGHYAAANIHGLSHYMKDQLKECTTMKKAINKLKEFGYE